MAFTGNKAAIFAKIAQAQTTQGGNWIKPGRYLFCVERLILDSKRKGTCFIIELRVIESAPTDKDAKGEWIQPNAPGSKCSNVLNLDTNDSAAGNVKAFLLALYDEKEPEAADQKLAFAAEFAKAIEVVTEPDQPARGMLIADLTYTRKIEKGKNAGGDFVGHNWAHVPGQADEAIKARRGQLDRGEVVTVTAAAA